MKTSLIKIRIAEEDKAKIELFADRTRKSVSEVLRQAASSAIRGEVPGARERRACVAVRRSANHVLAILETRPIELDHLRSAVVELRASARELVQCR
jgi:hypothetical protein